MVILGISDGADAAAAIVVDGRIAAAVEQERIDRVRHSAAFPSAAIDAALDTAGVRARDVDRIVIGGGTRPGLPPSIAAALRKTGLHMVGYELIRRQIEPRLRKLGFERASIEVVEQDRAQTWAAYRTQGDDPVLILLIDGSADGAAVTVSVARHGQIEPIFLQSTLALLARAPGLAAARLGVPASQLGVRAGTSEAPAALVEAFTTRFGFDGTGFRSDRPRRTRDPMARFAARYPAEALAAAAAHAIEETVLAFVTAWMRRKEAIVRRRGSRIAPSWRPCTRSMRRRSANCFFPSSTF